jgi:uncharacterized protein (DUF1778 family)
LTDFMLDAASLRAEDVIASAHTTVVPGDFFDALWDALDEPAQANERLTQAFKESRERRVVKQARGR